MERKAVIIEFKSKQDFRNRICKLWQNQKENEIYEFIFPNKETEEDFEQIVEAFK